MNGIARSFCVSICLVAACTADGMAWQNAGDERTKLKGLVEAVRDARAISRSDDGRAIALTAENSISVWSGDDGQLTTLRDLPAEVYPNAVLAGEPGQPHLVVYADANSHVFTWHTDSDKPKLLFQATALPCSVAAYDGGRIVALGRPDGRVNVLDSRERKLLWGGNHGGSFVSVAISPDGREIASAGSGGSIQFWEPATGKVIRKIQVQSSRLGEVRYSNSGRLLVAAEYFSGVVAVVDLKTNKIVKLRCQSIRENELIQCIDISRDERVVVAGTVSISKRAFKNPSRVVAWNLEDARVILEEPMPSGGISSLALVADDTAIAYIGNKGVVLPLPK